MPAVRRRGMPSPTREFMFEAGLSSSPGIGIVIWIGRKRLIHVCSTTSFLTSTIPQEIDEQEENAEDAGDKTWESHVVGNEEVVGEEEPRDEENKNEDDWKHCQLN